MFLFFFFFFFNDTATTEIYTLSLHDALPISLRKWLTKNGCAAGGLLGQQRPRSCGDRKSTRLNSSHLGISYAVFCLKKKKKKNKQKPHHKRKELYSHAECCRDRET